VNLQSDDFALFGLTQAFAQDRAALDARWKALQREAHPDKFALQDATAQRVAMQWSVRINEAYQRLKDPLKRAAYLCELAGFAINAHSNTAMPSNFLIQQMEWRESLEDASTIQDLTVLQTKVNAARDELLHDCARLIDSDHDFAGAVQKVRALMFLDKFGLDLDRHFEKFE
jgi:molecular chaperone HscB